MTTALTTESMSTKRALLARSHVLWTTDIRNVCILLCGFGFVLFLIPPVRSFPINDDWAYVRSVNDLLHWSYKTPDWAQATSFTHILWGALFSLLFGNSFTALSAANLVMSFSCLGLFYIMLRHLQIGPSVAFLGVALVGLNPIYIYISYSFMTDITFLAFGIGALLCYIRALKEKGDNWFWFGSLASAFAYLTRQFGLLIPLVVLAYLWWSRSWSWRRATAVIALPLLALLGYALWAGSQPPALVDVYLAQQQSKALQNVVGAGVDRMQLIAIAVVIPALSFAPLLMRVERRQWRLAVPIFAVLVLFLARSVRVNGTALPVNGDIIDHTGGFACCNTAPIWPEWVWGGVVLLGAAVFSIQAVICYSFLRDWLRSRPRQVPVSEQDPAVIVYAFSALVLVITLVATPFLFDRYLLPAMPVVILPLLRRLDAASRTAGIQITRFRWLVLIPLALFAIAVQHDYMARAEVKWAAGQKVLAAGSKPNQVYDGFEWQSWYLYRDGESQIRQQVQPKSVSFPPDIMLDPVFVVAEFQVADYEQVGSLSYTSWLNMGQCRHVLTFRRK